MRHRRQTKNESAIEFITKIPIALVEGFLLVISTWYHLLKSKHGEETNLRRVARERD